MRTTTGETSRTRIVRDERDISVPARGTFTLRAILIGVALTGFLAWLSPYSIFTLVSSQIYMGTLPVSVVAATFLLVVANAGMIRRFPARALNAGELALVVAMTWVGAVSFTEIDVIGSALSIMASPNYFATPENRWAEYYLAYMPSWAIPPNTNGEIRDFYNGLSPGDTIPWAVWQTPFFWWGSLVAAVFVVVICLMTIVYEQWHDHEKLTFPMAEVPLALIGRDEPGDGGQARGPAWIHSRLFWIGASIPLFFIGWNIIHWFNPLVPRIGFTQDETGLAIRYFRDLYTKVDFFTIGLSYFAPLQVLRGFWLGRLLISIEMGFANRFGFGTGMHEGFEPFGEWGSATIGWQCLGALMMFALWGFWVGREHFRRVLRAAVSRRTELPEHLRRRYRTAVWGLAGGLAYIGIWFHQAGMTWPVIALFLPTVVLLTIGMAKVVVLASFHFYDGPVAAQTFVMQTLGTAHIPQVSMTALALSYVMFRSNNGSLVPQALFAGKLGDERGVPRGKLYGALGLAVLVGLVVATITVVVMAYDVGAYNFPTLAYTNFPFDVYDSLARKTDDHFTTDWYRVAFFGIGTVLMAAVLAIRARFAGFWLHPVGLAFTSTSVAGLQFINIFLVWSAKRTLDRLGGIRLVNRARPFFLGLICGHAFGVAFGLAIDAIWFPGYGHRILTGW